MEAGRTYRATAIVLRRVNIGETDRILTLYTREKGKLSAVAKGARKPLSKLAGATEPFTYGRYFLAVGKELDVLTQAEVKESFQGIRKDLKRIAHATYLVELVNALVEEREVNYDLFDTLLSALYLFEAQIDPEIVARYFELHVMSMLGYRPELDSCLRCDKTPSPQPSPARGEGGPAPAGPMAGTEPGHYKREGEGITFSPSAGGRVCEECGPLPDDVLYLSAESTDAMRRLLRAEPTGLKDIQFPEPVKDELFQAIRWYVRYRVDRDIKSSEFIQALALAGHAG